MTPVKICGITRREDAQLAVNLGAAALGFIFYRPSPRYVTPERVAELMWELPPFVTTVGVFVDEPVAEMNAIAERCRLDRIQLHGHESPETLAQLIRPGYRAFRLQQPADLDAVAAAPDRTVLLDTYQTDLYGGTGRPFDWSWARRLVERLGEQGRRVILAGGLTPENIGDAIRAARPYAVDVCSGVEARPGKKDPVRMRKLLRAAGAAPNKKAAR